MARKTKAELVGEIIKLESDAIGHRRALYTAVDEVNQLRESLASAQSKLQFLEKSHEVATVGWSQQTRERNDARRGFAYLISVTCSVPVKLSPHEVARAAWGKDIADGLFEDAPTNEEPTPG